MRRKSIIALGANLPNSTRTPKETLEYSLGLLESESTNVTLVSRWFSTPAFPVGHGPDYVNAAAVLSTDLDPVGLLRRLHEIEAQLGRTRAERWGARACDLDLIDYDGQILPDRRTYESWRDKSQSQQMSAAPETLILPHPRVHERAFVLVPIADVAPDWVHPVSGVAVAELIAALDPADLSEIRPIAP